MVALATAAAAQSSDYANDYMAAFAGFNPLPAAAQCAFAQCSSLGMQVVYTQPMQNLYGVPPRLQALAGCVADALSLKRGTVGVAPPLAVSDYRTVTYAVSLGAQAAARLQELLVSSPARLAQNCSQAWAVTSLSSIAYDSNFGAQSQNNTNGSSSSSSSSDVAATGNPSVALLITPSIVTIFLAVLFLLVMVCTQGGKRSSKIPSFGKRR